MRKIDQGGGRGYSECNSARHLSTCLLISGFEFLHRGTALGPRIPTSVGFSSS
jgi:hypothetical protein